MQLQHSIKPEKEADNDWQTTEALKRTDGLKPEKEPHCLRNYLKLSTDNYLPITVFVLEWTVLIIANTKNKENANEF
jgi:hypothetical protein